MRDPQHLASQLVSTVRYGDSFTFSLLNISSVQSVLQHCRENCNQPMYPSPGDATSNTATRENSGMLWKTKRRRRRLVSDEPSPY
jgi:hypothetical protein